MLFSDVAGHELVKRRLKASVLDRRIPHAMLFSAQEGTGGIPMALAFIQYACCQNPGEDSCGACQGCRQVSQLNYPDLHFLFPQPSRTKKAGEPPKPPLLPEFRKALLDDPYLTLGSWYDLIEMENKQGLIAEVDVSEVSYRLNLKAFGTGSKFCLAWLPEKMNVTAANKILKILEEPPDKTIFIFVSENYDQLLATIRSRLQLIRIPPVVDENMVEFLTKRGNDYHASRSAAHLSGGNVSEALALLRGETETARVMEIREWMLHCYKDDFIALTNWVEPVAKSGRESQKALLMQTMHILRESFLISSGCESIVRLEGEELAFATKFSKLIHDGNCAELEKALSNAAYYVERNAHNKSVFLDLSLKIGHLLRA